MTRAVVVAVTAAVLATAGCGDDGGGGDASSPDRSDFQDDILRDGVVTFSEYESAVFEMVACLRRAGLEAGDPELESNRTYSYTVVDPTPEGAAAHRAAFESCEETYLHEVELGWADANPPDPGEEAAFYEAVAECLRSAGIEVAGSDPDSLAIAFDEHEDIYRRCFDDVLSSVGG